MSNYLFRIYTNNKMVSGSSNGFIYIITDVKTKFILKPFLFDYNLFSDYLKQYNMFAEYLLSNI